jgi:glucose/arabinose dehydrogenase
MKLNNTPPAGAVYAGWYAASTPGFGTAVTGLHHPKGDLLKISTGRLNTYLTCTPPTNGSFTCDFSTGSAGTFYDIGWNTGLTEPGSSGSGLFRSDGLLIGQLYGGGSTCTQATDDIYGRFDVAYNAALNRWLTGNTPAGNTLTVGKTGTGSGTVSSLPAGINCGATCTAGFANGTVVTLSAVPSPTSVFSGWSGACSGTGACVVAMSQSQSVTASFAPANATITVNNGGNGTVTSDPSGISCGATCAAAFPLGSAVTLTATPFRDMAFKGWSGSCSGTGATCVVTVTGALTVGATFGSRAAPSVTIATTANPSAAGQPLTLRATMSGPNAVPAGLVTFTADGSPIAGCTAVAVAAGLAVCTTSTLALGEHALVAYYSGDASYTSAQSGAVNQTIVPLAVNLSNLSTRGPVLSGNDLMIGGFVIDGPASKTVVVRAIGPSLGAYGIANPLANPMLQLVRAADQSIVASNDDWGSSPNAAQIVASGLAPANPLESAILATLAPGAYTAIVSGAGGATGIGMFEVYEVDRPDVPMVNMSTRGRVGSGADVMIGGLVVRGNGPQTVVIRARGPSLTQYGITNALADPSFTLVRASDNVAIAANDNWQNAANAAQLQATGFAPSDSLEAAVLITLNPGAYTAIVSGARAGHGDRHRRGVHGQVDRGEDRARGFVAALLGARRRRASPAHAAAVRLRFFEPGRDRATQRRHRAALHCRTGGADSRRARRVRAGHALPRPAPSAGGPVKSGGEQGLLGLAFHPSYASNGRFYVFYTRALAGDANGSEIVVARYNRAAGNADVADPASASIVIVIPHPLNNNHNGGKLAFGFDGYLYASVGDGGGGGDPFGAAQSLADLRGKIIRLDVDGAAPYAIPPDNPFANSSPPIRREIWAYGLRNPWRYSFDRVTGDLLIADVGQNLWEEVDFEPRGSGGGRNYGWSVFEGTHCFSPSVGCSLPNHTLPVIEYGHDASGGVSVTGGFRYRGSALPALRGYYVYGDYGSGRIWAASPDAGRPMVHDPGRDRCESDTFGEDESGELYVASQGGTVQRLTPPATTIPRLANVSTRGPVLNGDAVMIAGFVIDGGAKTVAITGKGPSLSRFGVANALANPTLQLVRLSDHALIAANDDWGTASNAGEIQARGMAPSDALESAILVTLQPGAYTAILSGAGGSTGVGLAEVYELDHPENPLINISTRAQVLGGDNVVIGGFVVFGNAPQPVVVLAKGPSLAQFGIANPLAIRRSRWCACPTMPSSRRTTIGEARRTPRRSRRAASRRRTRGRRRSSSRCNPGPTPRS